MSAVADEMHYLLNTHPTPSKKAASRDGPVTALPDDDLALLRATIFYAERRRRSNFLPDHLLGEPGWDILLDLFISAKTGRPTATSSAGIAAGVPPTTGLRWLALLEDNGMVEREPDANDARRVNIRLTGCGMDCLTDYLLFDRPGASRRRVVAAG